MLDLKFIREHKDLVVEGAKKKRLQVDIEKILTLDEKIKPLQLDLENLQAERNKLSKSFGKGSDAGEIKRQVQEIKGRMDVIEAQLSPLKADLHQLLLLVPQPPREDVPIGKDDSENVEIKRVGKVPEFSFKPKSHMQLGETLKIIDFERGVKLAGSRSYVLKGAGALLEQAVLRYTYDKLLKKNYTPLAIPILVKEDAMIGTGYFPTGRDQAYYVEKDELALVGTAEVSLTSYHSEEILQEEDLPLKFFGWSGCFRREAGTYGKDTQGLYRVHQFQKIEQVILAPNDTQISEHMHDEILHNAEEVLSDLGLAYRVVYVCSGDLGQGQVRKHDIETWMPSRNAYAETHSCSTFHEFQARRLKLRYKSKSGEIKYCHTLNNTAIASPRILIPLIENYQNEKGEILIPECLQPYMQGMKKIS